MAIKLTIELIRFLNAANRLYNQGFMKKEEILDFARREFGEISGVLKTRLDQIFKKPATGIKKQETKKGEVVELKPKKDVKYRSPDEFDNRKEYEKYLDEVLGPADDVFGNPMKDQMLENFDKVKAKNVTPKINEIVAKGVEGEDPDLAKLLRQSDDLDEPVKKPTAKEMTETALNNLIKKRFDRKRLGTISQDANARTAIREFLTRRVEDGTLKIPDEVDRDAIKNFRGNVDPIDVFRRYYGEDALEAADDMADSLRRGESMKDYEDIFRREMPPLKVKTEGAGQYDQSILDAERIMKEAAEDAKNKKVLEEFDISERKKNNMGGITRASYAFGSGLKLIKIFGNAKKLKQAIEDAVDNLIPSGDKKVDADMAIDDMLENANIDRDLVDQYDIVDAYGQAYDEILKQDDFTKTLKQLKDTGAVKTAERATLEKKYPGIDQNLLTKIIEDKDPQRKAEVLATLDEAMIMGNKGMSTEKIIETLMSTPRKKQAEGGLSYLMGM